MKMTEEMPVCRSNMSFCFTKNGYNNLKTHIFQAG
jgi:hypothetical protein